MDGAPHDRMPSAAGTVTTASPQPVVLFISADPVGEEMAGLGIRYWELARTLRRCAEVTIAHGGRLSDGGSRESTAEGVRTVAYRPHAPGPLRALIAGADVVVTHPQWPLVDRWLRRASARVVFDLYCPETLETLELLTGRPASIRRQLTATTVDRLHACLRIGHHFMCASETQRDLWLGAMLALRLIGPELYDRDPSLRSVVDLVPFGVPPQPPGGVTGGGPRDAIPSLNEDSEIVLWNGGIWNWLDAETAIRAVAALTERRPTAQLVFMGVTRGHPASAQATDAARGLARELGLLDSVVHFHEGWVPYAERGAWLTQADCALSTHPEHLEARFAYRTRLLDCLWTGLPIVCTSGDDLAERVDREGLGAVAPPGDVKALSDSLERVLERGREAYAPRLRAAANQQTWDMVAQPLVRWISDATPLWRPADNAPGALRPALGQRLREAAYLAGGRTLLARRPPKV
jgi:glycosyltransferase involved in cell wall biosynthesis